MKMNCQIFSKQYLLILFSLLFFGSLNPINAQDKKEVKTTIVNAAILDEEQNPVANAFIKSYELKGKTISAEDGSFHLEVADQDFLEISHPLLADIIIKVVNGNLENPNIILANESVISGENLISLPKRTIKSSNVTSSVYRVSGDELMTHPGHNIYEAINGKIPGLWVSQESDEPGSESYRVRSRGAQPLVLVDGLPRRLLSVEMSEIDEIVYMKDMAATAMYGDLGVNGILLVKTKMGMPGESKVEIDYTGGYNYATRLPEFVNAYDQANLVNLAAQNNGSSDIYTPDQIAGYQSGNDLIKYPDVDYHNEFLNKYAFSQKAGINFIGGNNIYQYYSHIGYKNSQGLEKVGEQIKNNELNFRTNLKVKLNQNSTFKAGINGGYINNRLPALSGNQFFNILSTYPANAMPFQVSDTAYVYSSQYATNLLASQLDGGHRKLATVRAGINAGLDVDLVKVLPGLSFSSQFSLDMRNEIEYEQLNTPADYQIVYAMAMDGSDSLTLVPRNAPVIATKERKSSDYVVKNLIFTGNLAYDRTFDKHSIYTNLNYFQYFFERKGSDIDDKSQMVNFAFQYGFNDKYIFNTTLAYTGYQKLPLDNQFELFPVFSGAWIISNESFMDGLENINYLKIRGSFGKMGYLFDNSYYGHTIWNTGGNLNFGVLGSTSSSGSTWIVTQTGNQNLRWPVKTTKTVGIEGSFFNNTFGAQVDLYNNYVEGIIRNPGALYSDMLGFSNYLPYENIEDVERQGVELMLSYSNRSNNFYYKFMVTGSYEKEIYKKANQVNYPEEYRLRVNTATDAIWGLEADGLFADQTEIDASSLQLFGTVNPGDIKYVDQNGDNLIDERDNVVLGNSQPKVLYGLNASFGYKRWSVYIQGAGITGLNYNTYNNRYYHPYGQEKYSTLGLETWPDSEERPALKLQRSDNNYRSSSFWLIDAAYFRLENVELAYTTPVNASGGLFVKSVKVFVQGRNLLLISPVKHLDPENFNAGYSQYPLMSQMVAGFSVKF